MSTNNSETQKNYSNLSTGCPFLGLREDKDTRFASPSQGNYCHKVDPAEPVNLDHQMGFCLSGVHSSCAVFSERWQGSLPIEILDENLGKAGGRKRNKKRTTAAILTGAAVTQPVTGLDNEQPVVSEPVETSPATAYFPVIDKAEVFDPGSTHHRTGSDRKNSVRLLLILVISLALIVVLWFLISRINLAAIFPPSSSTANNTATTDVALTQDRLNQSNTLTAEGFAFQTSEAAPTFTPEPTQTPTPSGKRETQIAGDQTATSESISLAMTLTSTAISCGNIAGYQVELISGPEVSPPPGFIYRTGSPEPVVSASWVIKNVGKCPWNSLTVIDKASNLLLVPILTKNGEVLDQKNQAWEVVTGDELGIKLVLQLKDAETADNEWFFYINEFPLTDRQTLLLKIKEWIVIVRATLNPLLATPTATVNPKVPKSTPTKPSSPPTQETPPTRGP